MFDVECVNRQTFQVQSLSSLQTTSRDAKPTQHLEITHLHNINLKLAFHKVASFHSHYLTHQTYHHPVHRFRSWTTQTTSQSHPHTRGNNKILRTPPPHISSSEKRLPRLTRRTLAQLGTNKLPSSNHICTKSTQKHHYAPSVTFTDTTHIISSTAPTYTLSPLDL